MLFPDGAVEEARDGEIRCYDPEPGLFDDLVQAGYPLHKDQFIARFDGMIDLRVDGDQVIAHTNGAGPNEHDMGPAGELFLGWFRKNAEEGGR